MENINIKLTNDARIECYNTGCPERPVSLHVNGIRFEMSVTELFRFRAAINQWAAQQPTVINPLLIEGAPLP